MHHDNDMDDDDMVYEVYNDGEIVWKGNCNALN
jgi:hypothetical protein